MKISGHETFGSQGKIQHMQLTVQSAVPLQKDKKRVIVFVLYLLLGGEEKDAAVQEGAGRSALLSQAGWLHRLLGTACCTEPSLAVSQASPTWAATAAVAWAPLGWRELGLHSPLLPQDFSLRLFSPPSPAPRPSQAQPPPFSLLGWAGLGHAGQCRHFESRKAVGGCREGGGLHHLPCLPTQPGVCREPLPGAWGTRAERPSQPSASPHRRPDCCLLSPVVPLPSSVSLTPWWVATHPAPPQAYFGRFGEVCASPSGCRAGRGVNPSAISTGTSLDRPGPSKVRPQPCEGSFIKLGAEGFYNVLPCVI